MHTGSDMRRVNECLSKLRNSHSERIMKLKKTLFRSTKHITGSAVWMKQAQIKCQQTQI